MTEDLPDRAREWAERFVEHAPKLMAKAKLVSRVVECSRAARLDRCDKRTRFFYRPDETKDYTAPGNCVEITDEVWMHVEKMLDLDQEWRASWSA